MPLQATSGAASYDAFGGGVAAVPNYIEDVFSTYLYTGNGSTQTITNGIDLAGKGGLTWIKARNSANDHSLEDTLRTVSIYAATLSSNTTAAQSAGDITGFTSSGFSLRDYTGATNSSGTTYASWTFREQPKFFDVVTYTGNGANRTIAHNLGSVPGCMIIKRTDTTGGWCVYHRSLLATQLVVLSSANAVATGTTVWNSTRPTSTEFSLGTYADVNANGGTYVAYLFAHDAGGFGLTGTDNVISCGSFTSPGGTYSVNLGYEPQYLIIKQSNGVGAWNIFDSMRGLNMTDDAVLRANATDAEVSGNLVNPTATGFNVVGYGSGTYIYIAIRRGPMKVPTSGTSVFAPVARTGTGSNATVNVGFPPDLVWETLRSGTTYGPYECDRLRGSNLYLTSTSTTVEASAGGLISFDAPNGNFVGNNAVWESLAKPISNWAFRRAPSFFDEVCYTGTISATQTFNHNLGVTPELIFLKRRDSARDWVGWQYQGTNGLTGTGQFLNLNLTAAANASTTYNDGYVYGVSATQFAVDGFSSFNNVNSSCVVYLFATCAGVSKVGSYTGNGSSQTINCGFTGGARFVMIKATSTTGDWMVADSARGIVSGNDPYLELNNTNAEVTGEDWLDTDSTGFVVNEVSGSNANTNGVTYIYLAIA